MEKTPISALNPLRGIQRRAELSPHAPGATRLPCARAWASVSSDPIRTHRWAAWLLRDAPGPGTAWQGQAELPRPGTELLCLEPPQHRLNTAPRGELHPRQPCPAEGPSATHRTQPQNVLPPAFLIPITDFKVTKTEIISQCLISFSLPCRARRARTRLTGLCSMTEFKYLHSQGVSAQQTWDLST